MGYLIGCISPSYLIGRKKGYDVRTSGSCNAGASNTVIMAGKAAGIFVALFDILKATAACKLGAVLLPELEYAWQITGVSCVIGHMFPVFLGFRGGKGVLCAETMLLIVSFPTGLVSLLIFVGIVWATRYVSLGSICGSLIAPIGVLAACGKLPALLSLFCVILLIVKHRSNIRRLIEHKESKLSFQKALSDKFDDEDF